VNALVPTYSPIQITIVKNRPGRYAGMFKTAGGVKKNVKKTFYLFYFEKTKKRFKLPCRYPRIAPVTADQ
jgi:hypothetical protein